MATRFWLSLSLSALMTGSATAQSVQSVLQTTATAMDMENLTSIPLGLMHIEELLDEEVTARRIRPQRPVRHRLAGPGRTECLTRSRLATGGADELHEDDRFRNDVVEGGTSRC